MGLPRVCTNLFLKRKPFEGSTRKIHISVVLTGASGFANLGTWWVSPGDVMTSASTSAGDSRLLTKSASSSSPSWVEPGSVIFTSGPRPSNSIPFWDRRFSYFRSRSTRSLSATRFFRRLGGCGGITRHSTPALTQFPQGLFLSQRTFLFWHRTQEWPRVSFMILASLTRACGAPAGGAVGVVCVVDSPSPGVDPSLSDMINHASVPR